MCGMDESIFVMVDPMVVVPYCIVINMMLPLSILRKKDELLVLEYIYVTAYVMFLTYIYRVMIIQLMRMIWKTMFLTPWHCIVPIIMLTLMF